MPGMDTVEIVCLKKAREAILEDLEAKFVVPDLVDDGTLTEKEKESILGQVTDESQVRQLLDILYTKGTSGFSHFVAALRKDDSYPWLADRLLSTAKSIEEEQLYVYQVLQRGGVPFGINHVVHRRDLEKEIRDKLCVAAQQTASRWWVVVHGMTGSGKSVLAAEALRDHSLLTDCFPDGVFWLPIGQLRCTNDILLKLHLQLDRINRGSHNDATTVEIATNRLRDWFSGRKALLVLDDVWEPDVLAAFDVGCPLLVTTRNCSIIDEDRVKVSWVKVGEELTLEETKSLFSKIMGLSVSELPAQVENVHQTHKGLPLLMAIIGSALKPYARRPDCWADYIEKTKSTIGTRQRRASGGDLDDVLQLIYDNLDEELRNAFSDFALFLEDVDIPSQVFEILWDRDRFEVEETLGKLRRKSLVRIEEDPLQENSYTYAIHDIYLNFLKKKCPSRENLHRKFVERILRWCDYTEIPCNQTYIYYYLGYHMDQAQMGDKLCEMFLNLRFIEHKIRSTGAADLISDYQRYERHFTNSVESAAERLDILRYLQPNAHLLSDPTIDVIQLALCQPRSSSVYAKAQQVARSSRDKPYYEWTNMSNTWSLAKLRPRLHDGCVNHAEFSPNDAVVVSVGEDRVIKLWDSLSGLLLSSLQSHSEPINCCTFSTDGKLLASASSDKTVRLWSLNERIHSPAEISARPRTLSQSSTRRGSFGTLSTTIPHSSVVTCCAFSHDGSLLVSGDEDGGVQISAVIDGHLDRHPVLAIPRQDSTIVACCFTRDGKSVVLARSDSLVVVYDLRSLPSAQRRILDHGDHAVCDCCAASRSSRYVYSAAGPYVWRWDLEAAQAVAVQYNGFRTPYNLSCCAISPDDSLIAAGTTQRSILLWNAASGTVLGSLKGDTSDVRSVRFSHGGQSLVSSSSDGTVVLWDVANHRQCSKVSLVPVFDVDFDGVEPGQEPSVATFDNMGYAQVCSGLQGRQAHQRHLDDDDEVTSCCFSYDKRSIIFGTKSGYVKRFPTRQAEVDSKVTSIHGEGLMFCLRRLICASACLQSPGERMYEQDGELQTIGRHRGEVTCVAKVSAGLALSCSVDGTIKLWYARGKFETFAGHSSGVVTCQLFDQSRKLLSCSENGELYVWSLKRPGAPLLRLDGHGGQRITSCDISPDLHWLLSGSTDKSICIWNADTGALVVRKQFRDCVRCCRFAPSSEYLKVAVGTDSGEVHVYDHRSGTTQEFDRSGLWVCDLVFSADGQQLASVSEAISWWSVKTGKPLQKFQLRGSGARALFATGNFSTFVTVDGAGILYILHRV